MPPKQQRFLIWLWLTLIVTVLVPLVAWAAPSPQEQSACVEEYTVQADDWLSKIAAKFLGDTLAYPAIVTATNQQQAQDPSFAQIADPDLIEVGWKICIPAAEEAQAMLPAAELMGDQVMVTDALGRVVEFAELPQRLSVGTSPTRAGYWGCNGWPLKSSRSEPPGSI